MTAFQEFCRYDYLKQLEDAGYSIDEANELAATQAHYFKDCTAIENPYGGVMFWIKGDTAFLFYILCYEKGKGHGKKMLADLEKHLKENYGITKLQLNVFAHNTTAIKLYKDYKVISQLMEKSL